METTQTIPTMNDLYNSKGRTITAPTGEDRTVMSVRVCYGASIEITLDRPLAGNASPLMTLDEASRWFTRISG